MDRLTATLFAVALVAPTIDLFLRPDEARSVERENRRPAPAPTPITDLATLSQFPLACESWFADRMGGRDLLLRQWQRLEWLELGVDPLPAILRGRDGFDFCALDNALEVDRGAHPFSEQELARVTRSLESQRDRCRRLGAEFVYVIFPNKETIYADKWPARIARLGPTRLEQVLSWVKLHSDVHCVDLRPALTREREFDRPSDDDYVYYPLGPHVTWRGALAAWNGIVNELQVLFPGMRTLPRSDYVLEESPLTNEDSLWDRTYVSDHVRQRGWWLIPRAGAEPKLERDERDFVTESRCEGADLPTCLFVHDSFGLWLTPYAARSFSHMWSLWVQRVPRERVENSRPQVVIHEATERTLAWDLGEPAHDVVSVSATEFRSFDAYFGPVDCARDPVLGASGGVKLSPSAAGWVIEQRLGDGLIEFPAAKLPDGAHLAVHVKITAPFDGSMLLYYLTQTEPQYGRARALALVLKAGENDLFLRLLVPELTGSVRMRLSGPGDYLLHAFEMRVAR